MSDGCPSASFSSVTTSEAGVVGRDYEDLLHPVHGGLSLR